jgi:hypothetical protein
MVPRQSTSATNKVSNLPSLYSLTTSGTANCLFWVKEVDPTYLSLTPSVFTYGFGASNVSMVFLNSSTSSIALGFAFRVSRMYGRA